MARSLGLAAYRAFAARGDGRAPDLAIPRPEGELLWLHCAEEGGLLAVQDLAKRQIGGREGLAVLITLEATARGLGDAALPPGVIQAAVCDDHPASITAFLDHWAPDCCVWTWGGLRPNLLTQTAARGCTMFLINADSSGFDGRRDRWLPDVARAVLPLFETVLARTPAAARRLAQLGLPRDGIEITSSLQAGGNALPCVQSDLTDLASACVGRAIWFANGVAPEELSIVLGAHRQALRLSHRLLLVLRPAAPLTGDETDAQARTEDFRVARWDDGVFPDETTQVLITEDPREVGLFYRVAPVSFLGGSLATGSQGIDPLEAAALGSAVLYGPRVGRYLQSYSRLAAAGGARIINDSAALGMAVTRLVAPDQAALMANAGWEVVSEGAELMDRITDLVQDTLDARQGARP